MHLKTPSAPADPRGQEPSRGGPPWLVADRGDRPEIFCASREAGMQEDGPWDAPAVVAAPRRPRARESSGRLQRAFSEVRCGVRKKAKRRLWRAKESLRMLRRRLRGVGGGRRRARRRRPDDARMAR
eukprot:CAMPEP_0174898394 /NCGR_PEP_ID=MMETSP0167-20121228/21421_1 /TAXON_ID=38298 /ORGANISM="Rhodella maculata, Strain CCMP736" /LENGTH=126 /DNA_ID=CAMNT_0016138967 /DNA_START=331 /DNA_END=712 /DNA_ORIENTATION=+